MSYQLSTHRERFTERVKEAIFFARYESCLYGSKEIEPEHLLLGLLRADPELFRILSSDVAGLGNRIRNTFSLPDRPAPENRSGKLTPLSGDTNRVLDLAARASTKLSRSDIATEHILLGLLASTESRMFGLNRSTASRVSRLLHEHGFRAEAIELKVAEGSLTPQGLITNSRTFLSGDPLRPFSERRDQPSD